MITKTVLGIASVLLVPAVCFADDTARDTAPAAASVPRDGWRSNVTLGAAEFPSAASGTNLGTGSSASVLLGREWMHDRIGIEAGLELESQSYGGSWYDMLFTDSATINTYSVRPTVRVTYYSDHWMPYAALGAGYSYASESGTVAGMGVSASDNLLAIAASAGVSYRIGDRYALGPYVRYEPCFEPALDQFVDFGVAFSVLR
jgi:hypothetical protein